MNNDQNTHSTLDHLRKNRKPIRNVNIEQKEKLSKLDRLALAITNKVGTMGFFVCIFVWTACWLGWNTFAPVELRFDATPACVIWLFLSNMIQIFLMPLIMIAQNLQSNHSEARAEADFEINKKAEAEIETVLHHLETQNDYLKKQNALILEILNRLEKKVEQN